MVKIAFLPLYIDIFFLGRNFSLANNQRMKVGAITSCLTVNKWKEKAAQPQ